MPGSPIMNERMIAHNLNPETELATNDIILAAAAAVTAMYDRKVTRSAMHEALEHAFNLTANVKSMECGVVTFETAKRAKNPSPGLPALEQALDDTVELISQDRQWLYNQMRLLMECATDQDKIS